jgi:hypothetical protein
MFPWGDISDSFGWPGRSTGVSDAKCNSPHARPSVHDEEPYPTRCDSFTSLHGEQPYPTRDEPVTQNTEDLKE